MDPRFPVKEEYPGGSSSSSWQPPPDGMVDAAKLPRPMEGLHDMGPPPFLTKTFDMVDGSSTDHIVSWNWRGHSFVVWDTHAFSTTVLPSYFKHNNFSSFVRQLNTYGFRKIDPDKWEFANESFLKGHKHLLKNITRRKPPSQALAITEQPVVPCVELGQFGLDTNIDLLRRDKQVLLMELVKLRQEQQNARVYLRQMDLRLQGRERKQQQMMSFLAKAMQNPDFINQLVQNKERRKELEETVNKKRRRPIEAGESSQVNENRVKVEPLEFDDSFGFEVSELEALALEMQGHGRAKRDPEEEEEEIERLGCYDRELDEGFWEELLNEGFDEETGLAKNEQGHEENENVDVLADMLGFLGSSPK